MATDWAAIEQQFILSAVSFKELAEQHGVPQGSIRARAHRFRWVEKRTSLTTQVTNKAAAAMVEGKLNDLVRWNEQDLILAANLRARVAAVIKRAVENKKELPAVTIRALCASAESAQRMARLAMNATTTNQGVSSPDGGPVAVRPASILEGVDLERLSDAELAALELVTAAFERQRAGGEGTVPALPEQVHPGGVARP